MATYSMFDEPEGGRARPLYQNNQHVKPIRDPQNRAPTGIATGKQQLAKLRAVGDESSVHGKRHESFVLRTMKLSRGQIYACISMFENSSVNLDPAELNQVVAISASNSLYVGITLLSDPFEVPGSDSIRHMIGNVGQPGIHLLVPPTQPKISKLNDDTWNLVNHPSFNGKLEDSFQSTSLHLSFTKYRYPASIAAHGYQAIEAYFIESLVFVFDRGKWIADLDIVKSWQNQAIKRSWPMPCCVHSNANADLSQLVCIDSWDEFLDRPDVSAIFRANGNWHARLAATALAAACQYTNVIVLDGKTGVCASCLGNHDPALKPQQSEEMVSEAPTLFIH